MRNFASKLAPVITEYLQQREILGFSDSQEKSLAMFDEYCCTHHPNLETLTKESVRGWVDYETSKGCKTMFGKVGAVRMLAQYMGGGAYILPPKTVLPPKRCVPYILTDEELTALFSASDNIGGNFEYAYKLMCPTLLRLMYTCGLRPSEARLIKRSNINFDTGEILIAKTKRHKERIVVTSDDMLRQCVKYDAIRSFWCSDSEYFFARENKEPISKDALWKVFNCCWQEANAEVPANMLPRLRPYDLRHRFASAVLQKWLNNGRDLYAMLPYLQAYMGHENFSHTAYYIHLLPENLLNSPGIDWSRIDEVNPEVDIWKQ